MKKADILQEVLDEANDYLVKLEAALDREQGVITNQGWIVSCGGAAMTFDVDPESRRISNPTVCGAYRARKFSEKNARGIATGVSNGRNDKGEAVPFVKFLIKEIEAINRHIIQTKKMM